MIIVPPSSPSLWNRAMRVESIEREVTPHLTDMWRLMTRASPDALALSAPQVGLPLQFFITNGRWAPSVVVNPEILMRSKETYRSEEGCLTWPGQEIEVERHEWVEIRFINLAGRARVDTVSGLAARIFQHEIDHLEGRCIFTRP